jgi:hypothetical protein
MPPDSPTTIGFTPGLRRKDHVRAAQAQFPAFNWYGHKSHLRCYLRSMPGDGTLYVAPPTLNRPEWVVSSLDVSDTHVRASRSPNLAVALTEFSGKLATYYGIVSQSWRSL